MARVSEQRLKEMQGQLAGIEGEALAIEHELSGGSFDVGLQGRARWRKARRVLLFLALVVVLIETAGVPGLRWTYQEERSGRVVSGVYLSVTGTRRVGAGAFGAGTCPLVALLPLERSLMAYAGEALQGLVNNVMER